MQELVRQKIAARPGATVYHRFLPENGGVVWNMSSGFGGRLLGALACDRVDRYVSTDPSTYAMDGLREMAAELVPMAEAVRAAGAGSRNVPSRSS